jgi:dihydroorotate dehydrogenase electron transfer subunit
VSDRAAASPPATFGRRALTVLGVDELGAYRVLRVADPDGAVPAPGQFAMLATHERWGAGEDERPYLPRAFSYARFRAGEAYFLLEDVGPGTRRLSDLRAGEQLWVLGPLGVGFTMPGAGRRAILVGGGVGIAPLAIWQDTLSAAAQTTVLLGFRDRDHAAGAALLHDPNISTDDGSVGYGGLVTELLATEIEYGDRSTVDPLATVYACGPPPMLEAVRTMCTERAVPAQLALEAGMACGFGACFGCAVPRRSGGYLRVCVDGPVLDAAELGSLHPHGAPAAIGQPA